MRRLASLAALAIAGAACSDPPTAPSNEAPMFSIEDAVHNGGNEHFYWLPPMASHPSYGGTFDGSLSPVVEICQWDGAACVLPLLAEFTTTTGPDSGTVRVVPEDEHYIVIWHVDEFNLDPALTYRIVAQVEGQELGHADVDIVSTGKQLRNVDTNEYIALKDGRTLPIKFRIEEGAVITDPCAVVAFADANLEAYVRSVIGMPSGPITATDVAGVVTLSFTFAPGTITSIEGIQCLTGLTSLSLNGGAVSDLTPLAYLTGLTWLSIRSNPVTDLTPISGLTDITFLSIANTQVSDLIPLAPLTSLTGLSMFSLPGVTDISPLAGMTQLESLDARGSPIGGTESSLASLTQMKTLTLTSGGVTDLSFMTGMTDIWAADLRGNQIGDLTPLTGLPLTWLNLDANLLADLTPVGSLTGLTSLGLLNNPGITDVSPLASLTALTSLTMRGNGVSGQTSVLQNLTQLSSLTVQNAGLTDLAFASSLPLLTTLDVNGNSISSASPVLGLTSLAVFSITYNPITCSDPVLVQLEANGVSVHAEYAGGGRGPC